MEFVAYLVLPVLGSYFLIFSMFYGMEQMGDHRKRGRGLKWIVAAVYTAVDLAVIICGIPALNVALMLLIPFLGRWMYHGGKVYLLYYVTLTVAVLLTDAAVGYVLMMTLLGRLYLNNPLLYQVLFIALIRLIEFVVIRVVVLLVRRRTGKHITGKQLAVSLVLPAFSVLNMYTLVFFLQVYLNREILALFLCNLVFLAGLNIYLTVLIDTVGENNRLERELSLYRQQARMQCSYYEREEQKYEESRKLIHDIRNHIQAMEKLYQEEAAEAAGEYAGNIHSILNSLGQKYYTQDKLLNIIINDKVHQMNREGVREDIKIGEVHLDFMDEMDITALFANMFDNAISAAAGGRDPFVKLRVYTAGQMVSVSMENSCAREPCIMEDGFRSMKKNHEGLGLKNMARAVEKYEGDIQYEWKDGVFYTQIMIAGRKAGVS